MSKDPTKAREDGATKPARQAPEADLPQAPPGAPEGHDAVSPGAAGPPRGTVPRGGARAPARGPPPAPAAGGEPARPPEPAKPESGPATSPEVDTAAAAHEP